jgi:lipopolysaccharide/colanic/teichoic acid biosynthesis glycosyltransferase
MGVTSAFWTLLALLCAAFAQVLADEFKAWRPKLSEFLIKIAVKRLPGIDRSRYEEEWQAYLDEIPGDLSKLVIALGFVLAAWRSVASQGELDYKRGFDLFNTLVTLLVISPVLVLVLAATRLSGAGPLLIPQTALGKGGIPFQKYRFRTMRVTSKGVDVTTVGRFLRWTSIEELPVLLNVLRGDMSMVGPRAIPVALQQNFNQEQSSLLVQLLQVRPGLTSPAMIDLEISILDELRTDLEYVEKRTFMGDLKIILRTVHVVLSKCS